MTSCASVFPSVKWESECPCPAGSEGRQSRVTRVKVSPSLPLRHRWLRLFSLPAAATFMEHWKRKQMRLNYRWDLTGFEEEEVSGFVPAVPTPRPCPEAPWPLPHPESVAPTRIPWGRRGTKGARAGPGCSAGPETDFYETRACCLFFMVS